MEINSHEWYEQVYHAEKNMPPFMEYIQSAIDRGYKARFDEVFTELDKYIDVEAPALEIGCHLGKTAYWLLKRYPIFEPESKLDMVDFSKPAVDYCRKNFPGGRVVVRRTGADRIGTNDNFYNFISCLDVSEHLTETVYSKMLAEIARILKSGGHCLFMGSMSTHNTHTNIRNPATIIKDADGLLKFVKMLPHNHILFRGI